MGPRFSSRYELTSDDLAAGTRLLWSINLRRPLTIGILLAIMALFTVLTQMFSYIPLWIVLLAIALGMPREEILISSLSLNNSLEHGTIAEVKSLNGDNIDYWKQDIDGLWIKLKANAPSQLAYAFSIK